MDNDGTQSQGERLRAWREQVGMTQQQVADLVRTSVSFISRLELDKQSPTVNTLCKIAAALGVPARDLVVCSESEPVA